MRDGESKSRGHKANAGEESRMSEPHEIFGTTPFDGAVTRKGYALNKMCFSFNSAANRAAFEADAAAVMALEAA